MSEDLTTMYFLLEIIAFFAVFCMHIVKTNRNLIRAYVVQSLIVSILLITNGVIENEKSLVLVGLITAFIKAVVAPIFFFRLKRRFGALFTPNNYLSMPLTLAVLTILILISYSDIFQSITALFPQAFDLLPMSMAMIFLSIFLMINHRGAFSQMLGILSLENSILLLATFIGIKQPLAIEMGIIFNLVIWMIIAQIFIALIYKQFGSLNVTQLKKLIEE